MSDDWVGEPIVLSDPLRRLEYRRRRDGVWCNLDGTAVPIDMHLALTEIERLRRWKSEAIEVSDGWERVYEAVEHRSADLGRSKSDIVLDRIAAKDAKIKRLRDENYKVNARLVDVEMKYVRLHHGIAEHKRQVMEVNCDWSIDYDHALWALIEEDDDGEARS